jgi:hypothetical protein
MYYTQLNDHTGSLPRFLGAPKTATAPIVRHLLCSAKQSEALQKLLGQPFTVDQVRDMITAAAGEAAMIARQAVKKLGSSAPSPDLDNLFVDCFGVGRKHIPTWRPAGETWNVGGVVRTRFERAARTLTGGSIHYSCYGTPWKSKRPDDPTNYAIGVKGGKYRIGFGEFFWREWKYGSASSPPAFLLGAALIIYFGPMMTGRPDAPKTVRIFSYQRFAFTLAGLELPTWVVDPANWKAPTQLTQPPATPSTSGQQPVSELDTARADFEQEKKRFEEAKKQHEERLKPHPVGLLPVDVLRRAGLTTTTLVGDRTASLLQTALERSGELRAYIENKLNRVFIPRGFVVHNSGPEFERAYTRLHNITGPMGRAQELELERVRGFFHAPTQTIHLRPNAHTGYAMHEAIHKFADRGFRRVLGGFLDEGVTQYFTDIMLVEQGLDRMKSHLYEDQLACANHFVRVFRPDAVARAYFQGGQHMTQLVNNVMTRLGVTSAALPGLRNGNALCERVLRLTP